MAMVSPNQPMLLTLANMVGALAGSARSARQFLAEQVFVADVGRHALRLHINDGGRQRPREKSPSGMFISAVNQRKPVGMNSPNGTRWCLS
jgi:hypothetical protein